MDRRIKFILASLGILAVSSTYLALKSFAPGQTASLGIDGTTENSLPSGIDADHDHDGLSNTEESIWNTDFQNPDTDGDGFLDGEEVLSGHDPTIPGPKDSIDDLNITEKAVDLVAAGLLAGDLKPSENNANYENAIQDISLATIDDFYNTQQPFSAPVPRTTRDTQESQETYLNTLAEVIKTELLDFLISYVPSGAGNISQSKDYFLQKSIRFKTSLEKLSVLDVPRSWTSTHKKILELLYKLAAHYRSIGSFDTDPLKAFLALNELENSINPELRGLLKEISIKVAEQKLVPGNEFYNVLGLIYP